MSLRRYIPTYTKTSALVRSARLLSTAGPAHSPPAQHKQDSSDQDYNDTTMPTAVRTETQWAEFGNQHISHGLGRLMEHVIVKGKGLELFTSEGKRLLDFTAGIGVTNLGQ